MACADRPRVWWHAAPSPRIGDHRSSVRDQSREPITIVAMRFHHLAGRVWFCPGDPDPEAVQAGVAVVADERGSVMIDAEPMTLERARSAVEAA